MTAKFQLPGLVSRECTGVAMEFHVAGPAQPFGFLNVRHVEIPVLNFANNLIECRDGFGDVGAAPVVGHGRHAVFLRRVIDVHPADFVGGAFFNDVGIHLQLPPIAVQHGAVFRRGQVGLAPGFEINDFNRLVLAANEVNRAFKDVILFDERHVHLGGFDD